MDSASFPQTETSQPGRKLRYDIRSLGASNGSQAFLPVLDGEPAITCYVIGRKAPMSEDNSIKELLEQTLKQMESDTLVMLRFTSILIAQSKNDKIWKIIVGYQLHQEPPMRIFGLLLNWMVTNEKPVMLLSQSLLDKYLSVGDLPRKTCDSRTWKQVEKIFSGPTPFLRWVDGKGRIENGQCIAGTAELVHPFIRSAMADYFGGELFLQTAKDHFISLARGRTPVVVSVDVNVVVDEVPSSSTLQDAQAPLGFNQKEKTNSQENDHFQPLVDYQNDPLIEKLNFIIANDRRPSRNPNFLPNWQQAQNFLVKLKEGKKLSPNNIQNLEQMYAHCPKTYDPENEPIELQNPYTDEIASRSGIPKSNYEKDWDILRAIHDSHPEIYAELRAKENLHNDYWERPNPFASAESEDT